MARARLRRGALAFGRGGGLVFLALVLAVKTGASCQLRSDQAIDVRGQRCHFVVVVKEPCHEKWAK